MWDTISRDLRRIGANIVLVVFPFTNRDQQSAALRNWDLWGPMVRPCRHARAASGLPEGAQTGRLVALTARAGCWCQRTQAHSWQRQKERHLAVCSQLYEAAHHWLIAGLPLLQALKSASAHGCSTAVVAAASSLPRLLCGRSVTGTSVQAFTLTLAIVLSLGQEDPGATFSVRPPPPADGARRGAG